MSVNFDDSPLLDTSSNKNTKIESSLSDCHEALAEEFMKALVLCHSMHAKVQLIPKLKSQHLTNEEDEIKLTIDEGDKDEKILMKIAEKYHNI